MKLSDVINGCFTSSELTVQNDALAVALERRAKQRQEEAAEITVGLIDDFSTNMRSNVEALRNIRKGERQQADTVRKIRRAFKYFGATGNPMPMFKATGNLYGARYFCGKCNADYPGDKDPIWEVPADFKEPVEPNESVEV